MLARLGRVCFGKREVFFDLRSENAICDRQVFSVDLVIAS
jgi:hypothetical protein